MSSFQVFAVLLQFPQNKLSIILIIQSTLFFQFIIYHFGWKRWSYKRLFFPIYS